MAFKYYGQPPQDDQPGLDYSQPPQQGISSPEMLQGLAGLVGQYGAMGGGGMATSGGATSAGGMGAGASGAGASGGSSMGSMASSAGPWAALAAIIYANERMAIDGGARDTKDNAGYMKDLFGGDVLRQDVEKRWGPKLGLKEGSTANKAATFLANPFTADPSQDWERFKDIF